MSGIVTSTTVRIHGVEHPIRGVADPSYIARLAEYVDEKMRDIKQHQKNLTIDRVAVLASLNIADELFRERNKKDAVIERVEEEASRLAEQIQRSLDPV